MRRLGCLIAAVATLALPAWAAAATCPRTTLGAVEGEVMCLECGTPLSVAEDAPAAQRERAFIEQLVGACRSKSQIEAALVAQYGDRVLALPRAHGFSLSAYVVPAVAVGGGLVLVGLLALRWRRGRVEQPAPGALPAADASKLEADLERYRL